MRKVLGVGINDLGWSHGQLSKHTYEEQAVYRVWRAMLQQCYDDNFKKENPSYKKRNLTVCDSWKTLSNFAADIENISGYDIWFYSAVDNMYCGRNNICLSTSGDEFNLDNCKFIIKGSGHRRR